MSKTLTAALVLFLLAAMVFVGSFMGAALPATGAPAGAVLTPVSNSNSNSGSRFALFFNAATAVADTRKCIELGSFDVVDYQWVLTQSGTNTTTITTEYSNNASGATWTGGNYVTAATLLSGTPVPASTPSTNMAEHAVFGRYNCVYVDVTNATPVTVYVSGVAK